MTARALGGSLILTASVAFGLAGTPARAGEALQPTITTSIERHYTTNAMRSDKPVADWYSLLRGTFFRKWGDEDAYVSLNAEGQATRHDEVTIEDDRAGGVQVQAFRRLAGGLELRGTLAYNATTKGDHIDFGPVVIGTRTLKQVVSGQVQVGLDLGNATALIVDATTSFEKAGLTHFENDIFRPSKLDPDKRNAQVAIKLVRTLGQFTLGVQATALRIAVERLGSPPVGVSLNQYGLRGEITYVGAGGATAGLALGAELLHGADDTYSRIRPAWQLTFAKPLPKGFDLRGTWYGRYETADSDDPLASWVNRGEFEVGYKLREDLKLASGVACEFKRNLLWENVERKRIFYAEATYDASARAAVVLRVDVTRTFKTVIDVRENTVDTFIALRAKI
jgi:hypothetical protein